ncbi:MAG: argininosuccinate lyase, partial [Bacteroidales bacterium]|nr:argininosuccinate lyase [Bacteroidales bacterium]
MKLWDKGSVPEPKVIEFTAGDDNITDLAFAKWDIVGSMAHVIMLEKIGLLNAQEKDSLLDALRKLLDKERAHKLVIEEGIEDIHSQVEKELVEMLGAIGKKVHTGRSRHDQVLVDIRLYSRELIDNTASMIQTVFNKLQDLSEKYKDVLIPGYTHMQPAMVSSFGMWFGSYAEALADDIVALSAAREMNNRNPLGTAAGYGSTLPLDRKLTTSLLEFDEVLYNSAYASLSRGKVEMAIASALASVAQTLGRFAMDACLFMTAEFRFIDFPDEFVTGSSIMPQKRNPDVFEIMRGKMNVAQTLPGQVAMLASNLLSGYNREYQLLKKMLFDGFAQVNECLSILAIMLDNIIVNTDITDKKLYK